MRRFSLLIGLSGVLALSSVASAQQDTAALQQKLNELKTQVRQLQNQGTQSAFSAKDVDAAVDSVLRDADRRSVLLAETGGVMAGWTDGGIHIRSADGNNDFQPYIGFQFRSVTNLGDLGDDSTASDGFEIRRMKFGFKGSVITPKLTYDFRWETNRSGGSLGLDEAFVRYQFADNLAFRVGQFKSSITSEQATSFTRLLAVDRSMINEIFNLGENYTQGVELQYDSEQIKASIAYTDGYNSKNTNFQDSGSNFGVDARVHYKAMGDWANFNDPTSMGTKKDLLVVGGAVSYTQTGDSDIYRHALEAQYESGPLSVYGAYIAQYISDADDFYNWGFLIQAGYMLDKQTEIFARADYMKFDDNSGFGEDDDFSEITVGVNYYLKGHSAKVTIDLSWLCNGSPSSATGAGILASDDAEFIIRGQFQLAI